MGKVGFRRSVLFMLHHQIDVLRSFVLLHDSPSARLADRVLMIHELRGSNPTPYEVPHILCSFIVRFRLSRVSCFVLSFYNSTLIPNSHTQVLGHFLSSTHSTLAFCLPLEEGPAVFGFNTRVLEWGKIWEGLERLTAVSIPASKCHRNWHKACICTVLEKRRKKGSILVLLAVFLGFRVCTGVFLIEQCLLERETDTKTSPTLDFALPRGNAPRKEGFNILLCILRMRPALTSTEDHVPPLVAFGSHRD
jgi:hypothetical protein